MPGPAPGRAASPAAAVPTVAKMPAPMIAPMPSPTRSHAPSVRFRRVEALSWSNSESGFVRSRPRRKGLIRRRLAGNSATRNSGAPAGR